MTIPSKDPSLYLEKQAEKAARCRNLKKYDAHYQCGTSAIHEDKVPWKGQCLPPEEKSKKEF